MADDEKYKRAVKRVTDIKRAMDAMQGRLDQVEDEWHQACRELDALEDDRPSEVIVREQRGEWPDRQ